MIQRARFKGFTLIELLTVMGMIGILATGTMIGAKSYREKAKIAKAKSEMRLYGSAITQYHSENLFGDKKWPAEGTASCTAGTYPISSDLGNLYKGKPNPGCSDFEYRISTDKVVALIWRGVDGKSELTGTEASNNVVLLVNGSKEQLNNKFGLNSCLVSDNWTCGKLLSIKDSD
jgi:prepilin-type N-terminal cleavage/methylation domain-containing protein